MRGKSSRLAACRWNHENIWIAVVIGGECNPVTVRREKRVALGANARSEPLGIAAFAAHHPNISRVTKGDLVAADRRMPDKQRLGRIRAADGRERDVTEMKFQRAG